MLSHPRHRLLGEFWTVRTLLFRAQKLAACYWKLEGGGSLLYTAESLVKLCALPLCEKKILCRAKEISKLSIKVTSSFSLFAYNKMQEERDKLKGEILNKMN
jgi:hypothetical protein